MSLEGLRAWIGEVERKLGMRTRVFLALAVIAIGIGGAAIYLAIDARESSVSQDDVQALQEQLEARIGTGGTAATAPELVQLEAELQALQAEVATLEGEGGKSQKGREKDGGASSGISPGSNSSGTNDPGGGASAGSGNRGKIQDLIQQAQERSEELE